ncbi:PTS lactose transporter subunit IIB, partial [Vibrio anguillarum]|uniref:PTS transporter subunit EIIB n=1 Tax=Vibrio anguillarum TaxID=55601 RepID=UPI00188D87E9
MQLTETNMAISDSALGKADSFSMKLQELVAALGGNENIANIPHCMTRLRFKLVDESKANKEKLEAIQGVKGVVLAQGQTQVIIGVEVEKWYLALSGASAAPE